MEFDDYLLISGIQHFSFCRRQWALIHIEQQWEENSLTAEGNVVHERVHKDIKDNRNGVLTIRGLRIKSETYHITGVCDAVEFVRAEEGISLNKKSGYWKVQPVEYKHGNKKFNDCDRLQAVAQAICLEEMFACKIDTCSVYYCETRRRETIEITDEYRLKLHNIINEMWDYYTRKYTPRAKCTPKCKNCSLNNICLPEITSFDNNINVEKYIKDRIK